MKTKKCCKEYKKKVVATDYGMNIEQIHNKNCPELKKLRENYQLTPPAHS